MSYLLFFLSIGLATALTLVIKRLQQRNKDHIVDQQRLKEVDNRLQEAEQKLQQRNRDYILDQQRLQEVDKRLQESWLKLQQRDKDYQEDQHRLQEANRRLQEIEQKYGGIISREDFVLKLDTQISTLTTQLQQLNKQAKSDELELSSKILLLRTRLQGLEEQEIVEAFGFYDSKYDFQGSEEYKQRLDNIRAQQKQIIKDKQAAVCLTEWTVDGSLAKGKKMTNDFIKLVLRAFNGECDSFVVKVKYNNIRTMENRIKKTYDDLNKLSQTTHCEITPHFLDLKLQELWLTHEYQERRYQEQEEQRIIREQMREEEKALREIEKAKQDAEREERRYQEALEKARRDIETGASQSCEWNS